MADDPAPRRVEGDGAPGAAAPRDPAADLRRIAYLLERSSAATQRVRAFRTAAGIVASLPDAELRARAAGRTLTELPGIGKSTSAVIEDSLAGRLPTYLAGLEQSAAAAARGPDNGEGLDPEAARLLRALRGDLHTHSDWSDGGSPIEEMAEAARDLGREYQALTDHSPRLTVARGLSAERLQEQLEVLEGLRPSLEPFRLLSGIEVDILDDGALDQSDELLGRLDVVVASVHSKLRMDSGPMTARMIGAIANEHTDILGHCTGRMVTGSRQRPESAFDADLVFAACAQLGVAVEINSRPERLDPPMRLLEQAVEAGCLFSIDTDAHAPGQLEWLRTGAERAARAGVPLERIVTAWPVEDLLEWTRDHYHRPDPSVLRRG
jgi:putative hydrolase